MIAEDMGADVTADRALAIFPVRSVDMVRKADRAPAGGGVPIMICMGHMADTARTSKSLHVLMLACRIAANCTTGTGSVIPRVTSAVIRGKHTAVGTDVLARIQLPSMLPAQLHAADSTVGVSVIGLFIMLTLSIAFGALVGHVGVLCIRFRVFPPMPRRKIRTATGGTGVVIGGTVVIIGEGVGAGKATGIALAGREIPAVGAGGIADEAGAGARGFIIGMGLRD